VGCYSLNVNGSEAEALCAGTVDFFRDPADTIDDWYIIPFEALGRKEFDDSFHAEKQAAEVWEVSGGVGVVAGGGDWDCRCGAEGEGLGGEGKPGFLAGLGMRKFFLREIVYCIEVLR